MPSTTLLTRQIRDAAAAGDFGGLDPLLSEYGAAVELEWRAASEDRRRELERDAAALLTWTKHTILASRAHLQQGHAQFTRQAVYRRPAAAQSSVEIDG